MLMKKAKAEAETLWHRLLVTAGLFGLSLSILSTLSLGCKSKDAYPWVLPSGLPRPIEPEDNPVTRSKVELGRRLFYDTRLSVNATLSCATCHQQKLAFTDGRPRAVGVNGELHARGAMSLVNVAYGTSFGWGNPVITSLEKQAMIPLFTEHPVEFGLAGHEDQMLARLRTDPRYPAQFAAAFQGDAGPDPISIASIVRAIASFERTLISYDSPYDRHLLGQDQGPMSASAQRGEMLFHSERLECFHCHGGFFFTDSVIFRGKTFVETAFHNNGLYNLDGKGAYPKGNAGVYESSGNPADMGRFKAPTLRNIALTAPYMHDGSIATLEEVLDHYAAGGRTLPAGPFAGNGSQNPNKSTFLLGFTLTPQEKKDVLAFLNSLTDEGFIRDPRFADPGPN